MSEEAILTIRNRALTKGVTAAEMWTHLQPLLPRLAELARYVFCLTAGNAATEREVKALHRVITKYRASMHGSTASKELLVLSATRRGLYQPWRQIEPTRGKKRHRLTFAERRAKVAAAESAVGSPALAEAGEDEFQVLEEEQVEEACNAEAVEAMQRVLEGRYLPDPDESDDETEVVAALAEVVAAEEAREILPYDYE